MPIRNISIFLVNLFNNNLLTGDFLLRSRNSKDVDDLQDANGVDDEEDHEPNLALVTRRLPQRNAFPNY